MTFFAPAIAAVAIRFGPPENFALMVLGVICTLYMIAGSPVKGVLMVALGFLTAAIGIDVVNGRERFTFGSVDLSAGIELLAVVIGLFGVTEVLSNVERIVKNTVVTDRIHGLWPTLADWRASWRPMLRGSGLGFFLGLVPGGGPVTASFMSYALGGAYPLIPSALEKAPSKALPVRNPPTTPPSPAASSRSCHSASRAIR
jgi:putative tricarboxylic transport membrane protein